VTRWATGRPPSSGPDDAHYDATVRRLIRQGAALDEGSVYFLALLSPHHPTVEVCVADVCPDIDTALLVAASVRALVGTAPAEADAAMPARMGSRKRHRRRADRRRLHQPHRS
jgi:carboxylate-amine ligase